MKAAESYRTLKSGERSSQGRALPRVCFGRFAFRGHGLTTDVTVLRQCIDNGPAGGLVICVSETS